MADENIRKLFAAVAEAYEKVYLDAMILWGLAEKRVPNLEKKMQSFRLDSYLYGLVHSRFEPLYSLIETEGDAEALREVLKDIPEPRKPNLISIPSIGPF